MIYQKTISRSAKFILAAFIALILFQVQSVQACEIDFKIIKNKKEVYSPGDIIIVKAVVFLTHRNCHIPMKDTKFDQKGIKIMAAKKWKKSSSGNYERVLKLKVLEEKKKSALISAIRTCNKEGGFGSLEIKVKK